MNLISISETLNCTAYTVCFVFEQVTGYKCCDSPLHTSEVKLEGGQNCHWVNCRVRRLKWWVCSCCYGYASVVKHDIHLLKERIMNQNKILFVQLQIFIPFHWTSSCNCRLMSGINWPYIDLSWLVNMCQLTRNIHINMWQVSSL